MSAGALQDIASKLSMKAIIRAVFTVNRVGTRIITALGRYCEPLQTSWRLKCLHSGLVLYNFININLTHLNSISRSIRGDEWVSFVNPLQKSM